MNYDRTKELYQELVLDHNKNPRNFRIINPADKESVGHNPLCGDKLVVYANVSEDGIVEDVSFIGEGCAISKASASMMTQFAKGKHIDEVKEIFQQFHDVTTGKMDPKAEENKLGKLNVFAGVSDLPSRVKCATLSWHTLDAALHGEQKISTE